MVTLKSVSSSAMVTAPKQASSDVDQLTTEIAELDSIIASTSAAGVLEVPSDLQLVGCAHSLLGALSMQEKANATAIRKKEARLARVCSPCS